MVVALAAPFSTRLVAQLRTHLFRSSHIGVKGEGEKIKIFESLKSGRHNWQQRCRSKSSKRCTGCPRSWQGCLGSRIPAQPKIWPTTCMSTNICNVFRMCSGGARPPCGGREWGGRMHRIDTLSRRHSITHCLLWCLGYHNTAH